MHVRFFLNSLGLIGITPFSEAAEIAVDGVPSKRRAISLNQTSATIGIGPLLFKFEYTPYARTPEFRLHRERVWALARLRAAQNADVAALSLTPIPDEQPRVVGSWTLGTELGKGASGRVHSASDIHGSTVAIKRVEWNSRTKASVRQEINVLQEMTRHAKKEGCKHILTLVEVIGDLEGDAKNGFKDVHIVLRPCAHSTMRKLITSQLPVHHRMQFFQQLLTGIKVLHAKGWVHGDIKPTNVGIYDEGSVLLDYGHARSVHPPATSLPATPGQTGTIGYLAPEQEMEDYSFGVDI